MLEELKQRGWHISEDALYNYFGDDLPENTNDAHNYLLDSDIREIIDASDGHKVAVLSANAKEIQGPVILQLQKIRNVKVPKNQENDRCGAGRLLKMTLTDGVNSINALEWSLIKGLEPDSPPGSKLLLTGKLHNDRGFFLLTPSNTKVLGGVVEKLVEKWQFRSPQTFTRQSQTHTGGNGPPPWVPFGSRVQFDKDLLTTGGMRSMDLAMAGKATEAPKISDEFTEARRHVIEQAMQKDKQAGGRKS